MQPLSPRIPARHVPVAMIAVVLVAVLVLVGVVALGLHTPAAPAVPYEKTVETNAQ